MSNFPKIAPNDDQKALKLRLSLLQKELDVIEFKTREFEAILRAHLTEEIILEQELTVLYKQQKTAKKQKRLAQKKQVKGKGSALVATPQISQGTKKDEEEALRKKLYREAMLQVHPDKYSMQEDKQDLASEMTTKLIELYTMGSIEDLQAFHRHIFSGHVLEVRDPSKIIETEEGNYWEEEIRKVQELIDLAKQRHTYIVLSTYQNPMDFLKELQDYYEDRLFKLRRRTRTK